MKPVQTINRKVEVTIMKSNEINSDITLTAKEAETITEKLVAAGIDRQLVERVIISHVSRGCSKSMNCMHGVCMHDSCGKYFKVSDQPAPGCDKTANCEHKFPCNNYFRSAGSKGCSTTENCVHKHNCGLYGPPKKSDIIKLKEALVEKGIDIKKIHPKAEKLFRG